MAGRLVEGLDEIDVLLVNAPAADGGTDPPVAEAADLALAAFLARGGGAVALHMAASTLLGLPRWSALTGARWIEGVSWHPPLGPCMVDGHDDPRVPGDLELIDERYTDLALEGDRTVLASYDGEDGRTHPLVWAREVEGSRVLVDTFGHDARSFDSPSHHELLVRSLTWVAGG